MNQNAPLAWPKNTVLNANHASRFVFSCENISTDPSLTGMFATVGCHPTRSKEFETHKDGPAAYLSALEALIQTNLTGRGRVVALGECGLGLF
jgi:Tat protein secretion system quality control protein TatD with DNase activity